MSLWDKIKRGAGSKPAAREPAAAPPPAPWLAADDPSNPFGVPIVSLMQNLQLTSTSKSPQEASCAVSWRAGQHDRFAWDLDGERIACAIELSIEAPLPDGLLFIPKAMEDKWAIAWKQGRIAAARSWTGETLVVADARVEPGKVTLTRLTFAAAENNPFSALGDPVRVFHWLLLSHALGMRIPFPASQAGAALLHEAPLAAMSLFGHRLFCAAIDCALPPQDLPLRSDGELVAAIADRDNGRIERLLDAGHSLGTPSRWGGFSALHLAIALKDGPLVARFLSRGANPNQDADRARKPLTLAVVMGCDDALLTQLLAAGADLECQDAKGFRPLHAAAETNKPAAIRFLHARGATLEARTANDLTALHIACALGHLDAAKELVRLGADAKAASELGTPLTIAQQEGKGEVVRWLERL